ncbi:MAG: hypothetical protein RR313_02690 [Anaerovoracaceae bacterium]
MARNKSNKGGNKYLDLIENSSMKPSLGFEGVLNTREPQKVSQEIEESEKEVLKTVNGLYPGEARVTYIISEETAEGMKNIAYWTRKNIKVVVEEALREYMEKHPESAKERLDKKPKQQRKRQ